MFTGFCSCTYQARYQLTCAAVAQNLCLGSWLNGWTDRDHIWSNQRMVSNNAT